VDNKIWGITGAALLVFSFVPTFSVIFTISGLIFLGIAIISYDEEEVIFNNFLMASFLTFLASVLFYFKLVAVVTGLIFSLFSSNPLIPFGFSIVIYFLIYYILQILSAVYFKKSFFLLGVRHNNKFFKISGNFLIAGAVLNIFFIGLILWIIGWVLVLVGFLTVEEVIEAEVIEEEKLPPPEN
jgi:uncharacterized membrane protein